MNAQELEQVKLAAEQVKAELVKYHSEQSDNPTTERGIQRRNRRIQQIETFDSVIELGIQFVFGAETKYVGNLIRMFQDNLAMLTVYIEKYAPGKLPECWK